MLYEVLICVVV